MEDIVIVHVLMELIGNQNNLLALLAVINVLLATDLQPANAIHAIVDGLY